MKQDVTGVNDTLTDSLWHIHAKVGLGGYNITISTWMNQAVTKMEQRSLALELNPSAQDVTGINDHLTDNTKISLVKSCITMRVIDHMSNDMILG